jgi:hypothetical protein
MRRIKAGTRRERDKSLREGEGGWLPRGGASGGDDFREQHQLRRLAEREIGGTRRPVLLNEA